MRPVHGEVAPGFEPLREAFARGLADRASGRAWERGTLALVFSATKRPTAACVHRLVERGVLALDEPIARRWPDFAARGKEARCTRC